MDWKWILGVPSVCVTVVLAVVGVDRFYIDRAEAGQMTAQQQQGDRALMLELYREKLKRLRSKAKPTPDDLDEIAFTVKIIEKLEAELLGTKS